MANATMAEIAELGRLKGRELLQAFEKTIEPYGDAIPEAVEDKFTAWRDYEIQTCELALTDAGMSKAELECWGKALRDEFNRNTAAGPSGAKL